MKIKLTHEEKKELLNAVKSGVLDTEKITSLQEVIDQPDMKYQNLTDEELDARIRELEAKFHS